MTLSMTVGDQLRKMESDWDQRARENARHFVATSKLDWSDEEFFASGAETVKQFVLTDMVNICQGKDRKQMRVLEIGCGAGRVTRALAELFGEVHAVDVSGEMIARAKASLLGSSNAYFYQNNGMDLSVVPETSFDFAFSCIVFQHIPSYEVIQNYILEVSRLLQSGSLFKFQVQGQILSDLQPDDTWVGVGFSEDHMRKMAALAQFEMRYCHGMGTQDFWVWFFRKHRALKQFHSS